MTESSARPCLDESMRRYVASMLLGGALAVAAILAALAFLSIQDSLPAPQIANSQCVDEKLRAMRINPPRDPNLLVVGSSVAWRHFNGEAAQAHNPGLRPYNAGFCRANVTQTLNSTDWLLGRLPSVKHVLFIASPIDFENCQSAPAMQFDVGDADRYVFGRDPVPVYYLKYFDPVAFIRNASMIKRARQDHQATDSMVISATGDGPNAPPWRGLHYGQVYPQKACFRALRQLAMSLDRRGIQLDVTLTPMHPAWKARYGGGADAPASVAMEIEIALRGTGGRYHAQPMQPESASFYDAIHMRWAATTAYTIGLLGALGYTSS